MNLLLDTHIWIWNHLESWRIRFEVAQALGDLKNELWLSPVSIWELVTLMEKKRVVLDGEDVNSFVEKSKRDLLLREAPFSWEVAKELRFTPLAHRDPADRLLVATARVHDLTLVTADERLMRVEGLRVLANR